jgi:hypothetical protein
MVVIDWNRWSPSIGLTGRLQLEQVVAINRCAQSRTNEWMARLAKRLWVQLERQSGQLLRGSRMKPV